LNGWFSSLGGVNLTGWVFFWCCIFGGSIVFLVGPRKK
jgi:hypothetical protein